MSICQILHFCHEGIPEGLQHTEGCALIVARGKEEELEKCLLHLQD